jgi:hypothetical protein
MAESAGRYCPLCGEAAGLVDRFCRRCGESLQALAPGVRPAIAKRGANSPTRSRAGGTTTQSAGGRVSKAWTRKASSRTCPG